MPRDSFEILDPEWASEVQQGLEEYMFTLYEAVYFDQEYGDHGPENEEYDPLIETESGIAFCGCNTCESREMLAYATTRIIRGYEEGKVRLVEIEE